MRKVKETIVVEGRYDVNTLKQCVDAHVVETAGFGVFNDEEKRKLIQLLAKRNGIIVFTDSDGAGFVIRNFLKGIVNEGTVKHAYIPEIEGKERRKTKASKEGMLGVEGMRPEIIISALERAGATFNDDKISKRANLTKADMFEYGLCGRDNSSALREKLALSLGLPRLMSANALLAAINLIFSKEEFENAIESLY